MKAFALLLALLSTPQLFGFIDTVIVHSKIERAKVYFSGAEVTRYANLQLTPGRKILLFPSIPGNIDPNTIVCSRLENLQIRAIKHQHDYSGGMDSVARRIQRLRSLSLKKKSSLRAIKTEIQEKGLSSLLSEPDIDIIQSSYRHLVSTQENLQFELNNIARELSELKDFALTSNTNILISVHSITEIQDTLRLRYFLSDATWSPVYDLFIREKESKVTVVLNAKITQDTGEEWTDIRMKFCTANSPRRSSIPDFSSFVVDANGNRSNHPKQRTSANVSGKIFDAHSGKPVSKALIEIKEIDEVLLTTFSNRSGDFWLDLPSYGVYNFVVNHDNYKNLVLNGIVIPENKPIHLDIPLESKSNNVGISDVVQFTAPAVIGLVQSANGTITTAHASGILIGSAVHAVSKLISRKPQRFQNGNHQMKSRPELIASMDYENRSSNKLREYSTNRRLTIMSDNSDHFVHLKQVVIPVDFIHYAAPKLRREVYHAFEIANWKACISAPATIRVYKNRMILHSSQLNPKDVGDTLRIFTGLSNAIIAKRQQISEKEKNRSKSTTKSMEWNIFVDNQLDTAVTIIVEDQYPLSESAFASTELLKNDATSIDKRRGILTWRLELEPDEKRTLQHGYTLKFPSGTRLYDK